MFGKSIVDIKGIGAKPITLASEPLDWNFLLLPLHAQPPLVLLPERLLLLPFSHLLKIRHLRLLIPMRLFLRLFLTFCQVVTIPPLTLPCSVPSSMLRLRRTKPYFRRRLAASALAKQSSP